MERSSLKTAAVVVAAAAVVVVETEREERARPARSKTGSWPTRRKRGSRTSDTGAKNFEMKKIDRIKNKYGSTFIPARFTNKIAYVTLNNSTTYNRAHCGLQWADGTW